MKTPYALFLFLVLFWMGKPGMGQTCNGRYNKPIFDSVQVQYAVPFARNKWYTGTMQVLKADVYTARHDSNRRRPAVLVLFGGSFITGSRSTSGIPQFCDSLARRGYVGIAIDYRIGLAAYNQTEMSKAVYRATQDCLAAVRYFRAHADSFGIDSAQIFVSGFSAGAITSLHAAFWNQNEVLPSIPVGLLGTLDTAGGNAGISNRVSGVISAAGGIGDTNWINPTENIPIGSVHNITDQTVPYGFSTLPIVNLPLYGSKWVTTRALNLGHKASLRSLSTPGVHIPALGTPDADTMSKYMLLYLNKMLACNNQPPVLQGNANLNLKAWRFYPNPARGQVYIEKNPYLISGETQLSIVNATGKPVFETILPDVNVLSVNLPYLPKGIYSVNLQHGTILECSRLAIE
jgi:para-nitrobenzyl esterase